MPNDGEVSIRFSGSSIQFLSNNKKAKVIKMGVTET